MMMMMIQYSRLYSRTVQTVLSNRTILLCVWPGGVVVSTLDSRPWARIQPIMLAAAKPPISGRGRGPTLEVPTGPRAGVEFLGEQPAKCNVMSMWSLR